MSDLIDQLSEIKVPPPPEQFADQVHQRLNRVLLGLHFFDFFVRAVPWALVRCLAPLGALLRFSFTGQHQDHRARRR